MEPVSNTGFNPQESNSSLLTRPPNRRDEEANARVDRESENRARVAEDQSEENGGRRENDQVRITEEARTRSNEPGQRERPNAAGTRPDNGLREVEPDRTPAGNNNREIAEPATRSANSAASRETRTNTQGVERNGSQESPRSTDSVNNDRLREFQTKDQARLERKTVSEAVRDEENRREKTQAAREPALEPPDQTVIRTDSTGLENRVSAGNDDEGNATPPNPTSVQTQRGQNIDDLI